MIPVNKRVPDPSDVSPDEARNHERRLALARLSRAAVDLGHMIATSSPKAVRTNRTSAGTADRSPVLYWTYEDINTFLFVIALVNALIRLAVRLHVLNSSDLIAPSLAVQALVIGFLGLALYAILKLRYHRPVLRPLGWLVPSKVYIVISTLGGFIAALAITYFTHRQGQVIQTIPAKHFFVLGFLLGPVLEESVFRGYLLPVLARSSSRGISVLVVALLFAAFHTPGDVAHWLWFTATGLAYGSLRVASQTTTAPAILHITCNLTLFFASRFS